MRTVHHSAPRDRTHPGAWLGGLALLVAMASGPALAAARTVDPATADAQATPVDTHWQWVRSLLESDGATRARKMDVLRRFLALFPGENPHREEAEAYLARLAAQDQKALEREYDGTTEWFAFQLGMNSYVRYPLPSTFTFDLFTLRWRHVYCEIIHMRGGGFIGVGGSLQYGPAAGVRLRLDGKGRHELRGGLGVGLGMFTDDEESDFVGLGVEPEASYLFRRSRHFAWEVTLAANIAVAGKWKKAEPSAAPPSHPDPFVSLGFGFRL